jgi:hypothetical protein
VKSKVFRVGADPVISLADLRDMVDGWINAYGEQAIFTTDAGYNNVVLRIDTRVKSIESYKKGNI